MKTGNVVVRTSGTAGVGVAGGGDGGGGNGTVPAGDDEGAAVIVALVMGGRVAIAARDVICSGFPGVSARATAITAVAIIAITAIIAGGGTGSVSADIRTVGFATVALGKLPPRFCSTITDPPNTALSIPMLVAPQ
ncbi:Hypothetical predicted protein [Octopus vulgaris]|uniref:Uncharacterized protein n=1 Tax=Octopus vulgaris TaxID=6645 RepID=A0AA36BC01_OCTVU|nr:Hypothetical predicted protein [Octopus vulgaris]